MRRGDKFKSYSTDQKKPNRERKPERVQNGYENGNGMGIERIQNGYRTETEWIRNGDGSKKL